MSGRAPEWYLRAAIVTSGAVMSLALVLLRPPTLRGITPEVGLMVLFAAVIIVIADSRPVLTAPGREGAPVGLAMSMALGMIAGLPESEGTVLTAGSVVLVVALSMALGWWLRWRREGRGWARTQFGMRMLTTSLVTAAMRLELADGHTLLEHQANWTGAGWILAGSLMVVAATAMVIRALLWSADRALREHSLMRHAIGQEATAVGPLAAGVVGTAVMVALAAGTVGALAVPLFMTPLLLLVLAVRRQTVVRKAQRQTIYALSRLTDQGGFTPSGHAARVARLSVRVGREMGMAEPRLRDLEYAALLHDIGQVSLERAIPGGATANISGLDQRRVAASGAALLSRTAELAQLSTIVAHQATPYWRSAQLGELPLASRILRVVNAYEDLSHELDPGVRGVAALNRLRLGSGYDYDPEVFATLCRVLHRSGRISRADLAHLDL